MAYEELAKYFSGAPTSLGPNAKDVAKFIVLNADVKRSPVGPRNDSNPSLMSRIFDVLSRPNYAVANTFKGIGRGDSAVDVIKDFISGLSGTQKTTFGQLLKENGAFGGNKFAESAVGLLLDVGLDPTTYIPGGAIAKGAQALKGTTKLGEAERVAKATLEAKPRPDILLPTDQAPKPFRELPFAGKTPEKINVKYSDPQLQLDLPGVPKIPSFAKEAVPSVEKVAAPVGQLALKFPDFKVSEIRKTAAKTIEDLPADLPKVVPPPKPIPEVKNIPIAESIANTIKGQPGELTKARMSNLLTSSYTTVGRKGKGESLKTYIAVENILKDRGFVPHDGVWLSDVIAKGVPIAEAASEFHGGIKTGSATWQAVEDLKASAAVVDAAPVQKIVESVHGTKLNLEAGNQLSDEQLGRVQGLLQKIAKESYKAAGVTPLAEESGTQLVKMALQSGMSAAQIAVEQSRHMINDIVAKGIGNPKANRTLTLALEKDLGKLPSWAVTDNQAVEFLMGRVATWWGQKDLRPLSLNQIASSISTAAARGQALDHMFAELNVAQRAEVFRLAQGVPGVPSSPQIQIMAQQVSRMMDNLVGRAAGKSVVTRSGVSIELLNKWMRQYKVGFEFQRGKIKDHFTGKEVDLSKGTDWLQTWRHVELPGDCKSCIFKLQQAVEQATREKALFDEIGERFGSTVPGRGYRTQIEGHPYLNGYYFTEDIAKQLPRVIRDWTTPGFQGGSGVLGLYDRVLSMWKAGVTIYRPGHHIRNMVGDVYLGWMDGVNSVRPYKLAAQVQRSMNGLYKDLMNVDRLVEIGALGKDMKNPMPGKVLFTNKSGIGFTAEQIGAVAHQKGLLEHARTIEDIIDLGGQRRLLDVKPLGGRGQKFARGASELQSHNARLAHFIDKVIKSRGSDLDKIFEEAARRARKWHPTGLDMTQFEKNILRRIIPFYSWLRKSTPLLIEGLVMNPGKAVIPSKVYGAIQQAQGIETPGRQDPFPVDQMFPAWVRQEGLGPIGLPGEGLLAKFSNQQPPGYTMLGMGLDPLAQMMGQFTDPGRTISTGLTPVLQVPFELMTGKKLFTGEPITGPEARPGSFRQYIGEQIPVWGSLQNIAGFTPFGSETKAAAKSGGESRTEALTNWLTGLGVRGTGPYRSQARFEALAPSKMKKKVGREEFLNQLRERLNGTP